MNNLVDVSVLAELKSTYLSGSVRLFHLPSPPVALADVIDLEVDDLLWLYALHFPAKTKLFRASSERRTAAENARLRYADYGAAVRSGFTLVLNEIERATPSCARICAKIARLLDARISANLYISPDHANGFGVHTDDHDVFAIQLEGRKSWTVAAAEHKEPHRFSLEPGDVLYVPRETRHGAHTSDDHSIHITIGVHPVTTGEVVSHMVPFQPRFGHTSKIDNPQHGDPRSQKLFESVQSSFATPHAIEIAAPPDTRAEVNFAPENGVLRLHLDDRARSRHHKFAIAQGVSVAVTHREKVRWAVSFVREGEGTRIVTVLTTERRAQSILALIDQRATITLTSHPDTFTDSDWEVLVEFLVTNRLLASGD